MKKLSFLFLGAAGLILASCSQEDLKNPAISDGDATITIQLEAPQLQTRASYGKGEAATKLQYALYEIVGGVNQFRKEYTYDDTFNSSASISISVAKKHSYNVVFWASAGENSPYTVDFENGGKVTVNYEGIKANDENLDAFFGVQELEEVKGDAQLTVKLYRPFAQINVGTNDYEDYKTSTKNDVTHSSITIDKVYKTLNLISGDVEDEDTNIKFALNEIPAKSQFSKEGYDHLAMIYLLASKENENKSVTYGYAIGDKEEEDTNTVGNVPVQRNYRTNLYGQLLTGKNDFTVDKEPDFDGDKEDEIVTVPDGMAKYNGNNYSSIKEALEAITEQTATVYVGEGDFTAENEISLNSVLYTNLTIVGSGPKTVITQNKAIYDSKSAVSITFENLKWVANQQETPTGQLAEAYFVGFNHIQNINYNKCTISGGPIKLLVKEKAEFNDCTFIEEWAPGAYEQYPVQYYSDSDSEVVLNNCTFNTKSKAVLIYCDAAPQNLTLTATNCKFNFTQPKDKAAIQINNDYNKLYYGTITMNGCQVPDNVPYAQESNNPTGAKYFDIYVDGELVQASSLIKVDGKVVSSVSDAFEKATDGSYISIPKGNYDTFNFINKNGFTAKDVTVNANGAIFTGNHELKFNGSTIVKNANFVFNSRTVNHMAGKYVDCTFKADGSESATGEIYQSSDLEFIGCEFTGAPRAIHFATGSSAGGKNFKFEKCEFNGYCSISGSADYDFQFDGCTFNTYNYYGGMGLRNTTLLKDCVFNLEAENGTFYDSNEIAFKSTSYNPTYTFTNCTLDWDGDYITVVPESVKVNVNGQEKTLNFTGEKTANPHK